MDRTDIDVLTEQQKYNLQRIWTPKEGDFVLNTSANEGDGFVFTNYNHQPYDDQADWKLLIEYDEKKRHLFPLFNALQLIELLKQHDKEVNFENIQWLEFDALFQQVYDLFTAFLTRYDD